MKLNKPAWLGTRFKVKVTIHESGIMDFEMTRIGNPVDHIPLQRRVPVRADMLEMAERAGIALREG